MLRCVLDNDREHETICIVWQAELATLSIHWLPAPGCVYNRKRYFAGAIYQFLWPWCPHTTGIPHQAMLILHWSNPTHTKLVACSQELNSVTRTKGLEMRENFIEAE